MYERSAWKIFRTTTGIQLEADASEESRSVMTCLTILGVTGKLYSFKAVLEGEGGTEIFELSRLVLSRLSTNKTVLSDIEVNNPVPLNRGGITDLTLFRITLKFWEKLKEPSDSDRPLFF